MYTTYMGLYGRWGWVNMVKMAWESSFRPKYLARDLIDDLLNNNIVVSFPFPPKRSFSFALVVLLAFARLVFSCRWSSLADPWAPRW